MPGEVKALCERCGKEIHFGETMYEVTLEATADFDGTLPEPGPRALGKVLQQAEDADPVQWEDDVHQKIALRLCRPCKQALMRRARETVGGGPAGGDEGLH